MIDTSVQRGAGHNPFGETGCSQAAFEREEEQALSVLGKRPPNHELDNLIGPGDSKRQKTD